MTEEIKNVEQATTSTEAPFQNKGNFQKPFDRNQRNGGGFKGKGRGGKFEGRREKPKAEFEQKLLQARRVTRVVSGGRRYSQAVALIIGDKKGRVGLGTGKAIDTTAAIDKAYRMAVKKMVNLKLTKNNSIPHELSGKYNSCKVQMFPNKGRGLIAGSAARIILNLSGVNNITAKFHSGSKNQLNNARATMDALSLISTPHVRQPRKDFSETGEGRGDRKGGFQRRDADNRAPRKNFVRRPFNKDLRNPQVETKVEDKNVEAK